MSKKAYERKIPKINYEKSFKWDGIYNGVPVNSGAYAYMLDVEFIDGSKETRSGNVTVTR